MAASLALPRVLNDAAAKATAMTTEPRIPLEVVRQAFPEAGEVDFLDAGGQSDVWRVLIEGRVEILRVLVRAGDVARVKQEIAALRAIDSEHLMQVYDSRTLEHQGVEHQVIRAEFIDGPSLETARQEVIPSAEELAGCAAGVLRALVELHARNLVHRDIKPQNVMLRGGDWRTPVVLDLGYIRDLVGPPLTEYPARIGTVPFMAPEQLRHEPAGLRSDIYALGITLFLVATRTHPFIAPGEAQLEIDEVLRRMQGQEWPDWQRLDGFPPSVRHFLGALLPYEPYQRLSARKACERAEAIIQEA
jgi:serine/threonine protein kinase